MIGYVMEGKIVLMHQTNLQMFVRIKLVKLTNFDAMTDPVFVLIRVVMELSIVQTIAMNSIAIVSHTIFLTF